MNEAIVRMIDDTARRMRLQQSLHAAARGAIHGGWIGIALAVALVYTCTGPWRYLALAIAILFPLFAVLSAGRKPLRREIAAQRIDQFYELKDRVRTALDLVERPRPSPLADLHMRNTSERLAQASARDVVALAWPRRWIESLCLFALLAALVVWPWGAAIGPTVSQPVDSSTRPPASSTSPQTSPSQPAFPASSSQLAESEAVRRYFAP